MNPARVRFQRAIGREAAITVPIRHVQPVHAFSRGLLIHVVDALVRRGPPLDAGSWQCSRDDCMLEPAVYFIVW